MPPSENHLPDDQSEAYAFLDALVRAEPGSRRVDTHANTVFLIGGDAYKMKRAVRFPFLDYSVLPLRRRAVTAELTRNRLFAPELYPGETAVMRRADGTLALGGDGELVEPLVHMRRFDESATLDHVAARGLLPQGLTSALAKTFAAAHAVAPVRDAAEWFAGLSSYAVQNEAAFRAAPELFPAHEAGALVSATRAALARIEDLVLQRGRKGLVRLAHGDAHLANVVLIDGAPVLFDAVEFDDGIATGDVLYDLGFALMDLIERGQTPAACHLLNRYLDLTQLPEMDEGLAALPLYISMRAAIRAKIAAASIATQQDAALADAQRKAARAYFALACRALEPATPRLVAIGGLSGTGKSTLAGLIAPHLLPLPGARVLRSDVLRKRMLGLEETSRAPACAYTPEASDAVYAAMMAEARAALAAGHSVILDAVHARPGERQAVADLAAVMELPFTGLWLEAEEATLKARVSTRKGDASDATVEVVSRQLAYDLGPVDWQVIGAGAALEDTLAEALKALGLEP